MSDHNFICVAGLPRSGSTLLCQLLREHPDVSSSCLSSPVCNLIVQLRENISRDRFFTSQLDNNFNDSYGSLRNALTGFMDGWYKGIDEPYVVDKNRAWLLHIETLLHLKPDAKVIVTLRDLTQVYASIENQHQKTLLLDFIDGLAHLSGPERADVIFNNTHVLGMALKGISALDHLPESIRSRVYIVRFEDLTEEPAAVMSGLFRFIGLRDFDLDVTNLKVTPGESDSHYNFKFMHRQQSYVKRAEIHHVPPALEEGIRREYAWFYNRFYTSRQPTVGFTL